MVRIKILKNFLINNWTLKVKEMESEYNGMKKKEVKK